MKTIFFGAVGASVLSIVACGGAEGTQTTADSDYTSAAPDNGCLQKVTDPNWDQDKHELVLSCQMESMLVGDDDEFDQLCFAVTKLQYGNYKNTVYKTVRSRSSDPGGLKTIVFVYEDGRVQEGGRLSKNGSVIEVSAEKESFEFGHEWIETTTVNLEDPTNLQFDIYKKKFLRNKLTESARYLCKKVL